MKLSEGMAVLSQDPLECIPTSRSQLSCTQLYTLHLVCLQRFDVRVQMGATSFLLTNLFLIRAELRLGRRSAQQ